MTPEEAADMRNLKRWANEELPRFRVAEWSGEILDGGGGSMFGISASGSSVQIQMDATAAHRRSDGSGIDVTSHRADHYAERKEWIPINMLLRTDHAFKRMPPQQLHRMTSDGTLPWTTATINVDGDAVTFEVLEHGGQWAAIGEARGVFIMIDSYGVELDGLRLVERSQP
jgi:hypothetical protein